MTGDLIGLIVALLICSAAAAAGGMATVPAVRTWYPTLRKPSWNPPAALFGPVWTALYAMMAVAAWLVWRGREEHEVGPALGLFAAQLALNVVWSLLFFGRRRIGGALVEIGVLWVAIVATAVAFAQRDPLAALLLAPYLAWVTFAAALNAAIYRANREPAA